MTSKLARCLTLVMVLLVPMVASGQIPEGSPPTSTSAQAAQDARLMEQADHQRRLSEQSGVQFGAGESGGVPAAEESSAAGFDVAVIVVMAASGLAFLIVCRLRGRSFRQCVTPRGVRRMHRGYPTRG